MNRKITLGVLIISFIIISNSCASQRGEIKEKENLTFADSLWIEYSKAMESKNIDFLIKNSIDTIECEGCVMEKESKSRYYDSKLIFRNHLDQLMYLNSLSDKDYSTYYLDSLIYVSYDIKARQAPGGGYNLFYSFIKTEQGFKLAKMFFVP